MGTLYIDRKDIGLVHRDGRLCFMENGAASGSVPVNTLDRVVLRGRVTLDTTVLGALVEQGIGMVIINPRNPERCAWVTGRAHNDAARRVAQYRASLDDAWRARWSSLLVIGKIRAQKALLRQALTERPDQRLALVSAIDTLALVLQGLRAGGSTERPRLRGIEGAAAAAYWSGYGALLAPSLGFNGRNRRPPRDPVNACLSLGYTLLHSEAVLALHAGGLDPLMGVYHDLAFGRESLASDLIEPLRPRVDAFVRDLFRERVVRAENFALDRGACLLGKAGRRSFYEAWESRAPALRRRLRRFVRIAVEAVRAFEPAIGNDAVIPADTTPAAMSAED